ncbi:MAG: hypothetical protein CFH40_01061, partial [Alphaproteobacteria bacterium MarineAlpha10_Bin3]
MMTRLFTEHPASVDETYQPVDEVCPGRRSHRLILWGPVLKGICRWQWDS